MLEEWWRKITDIRRGIGAGWRQGGIKFSVVLSGCVELMGFVDCFKEGKKLN